MSVHPLFPNATDRETHGFFQYVAGTAPAS